MKIICPECGKELKVKGLGRPSFDLPVIKVCDAVSQAKQVSAAAESLGVSRAYVYKVLKANGLKAQEVIGEK